MPADRTSKLEQQHRRLLDGLAASIRQKGLSRTQVSDIVGHARASRRTFYKHFPDKDSLVEARDSEPMRIALDLAIDHIQDFAAR